MIVCCVHVHVCVHIMCVFVCVAMQHLRYLIMMAKSLLQ